MLAGKVERKKTKTKMNVSLPPAFAFRNGSERRPVLPSVTPGQPCLLRCYSCTFASCCVHWSLLNNLPWMISRDVYWFVFPLFFFFCSDCSDGWLLEIDSGMDCCSDSLPKGHFCRAWMFVFSRKFFMWQLIVGIFREFYSNFRFLAILKFLKKARSSLLL